VSAAAVYFVFTLIAYLNYPGAYAPSANWLSDLGNPYLNPGGAIYYNLGCVITALCLMAFYVGLGRWLNGGRRMRTLLIIAQAAGIAASVSLILAAVFPLGTHTAMHSLWSKMMSVFLGFFLTFSATALMKNPAFKKCWPASLMRRRWSNFIYGVFFIRGLPGRVAGYRPLHYVCAHGGLAYPVSCPHAGLIAMPVTSRSPSVCRDGIHANSMTLVENKHYWFNLAPHFIQKAEPGGKLAPHLGQKFV
jgi:hypothetical membrane protein